MILASQCPPLAYARAPPRPTAAPCVCSASVQLAPCSPITIGASHGILVSSTPLRHYKRCSQPLAGAAPPTLSLRQSSAATPPHPAIEPHHGALPYKHPRHLLSLPVALSCTLEVPEQLPDHLIYHHQRRSRSPSAAPKASSRTTAADHAPPSTSIARRLIVSC